MKKIFSYFAILVCFLILGNVEKVYAVEIDTDDINNSTYLIGKCMFTRDVSESYSGSLSTDVIMLAAKTIDSNNLEDMIIYYKNARGVWVNALTNQTIEIDEKVNIEYKNNDSLILATPTLVNASGDLTTNNLSVVADGAYAEETLLNKLDGWELYVKENGNYEKLGSYDNGASTGLHTISVLSGDKDLTLVARVYVLVGETKIYSDYSNEVVVVHIN